MKVKKRTFEFTVVMFMFYLFSIYIVNWISGRGLNIVFLILNLVFLFWIIKIIREPHLVKNKKSKIPTILVTIAGVMVVLTFFTDSLEDVLIGIYLVSVFLSMAGLIKWYKSSGTTLEEKPVIEIVEENQDNEDEVEIPRIEYLRNVIQEALSITTFDSKNYNYLLHSEELTNEIMKNEIDAPKNIVNQMITVIDHYKNLESVKIKTKEIQEALTKLELTLKKVYDTLLKIYDIGMKSKLNEVEIDSETFERLIELEGLKESDFNLYD